MSRRAELPSSLLIPSASTSSSRSSSPPSPGGSAWHQDPYAPRQPGLPLYTARKNSHTRPAAPSSQHKRDDDLVHHDHAAHDDDDDMVELVDSSTARRRAGQSTASYIDGAGAEQDPLLSGGGAGDGKEGKELWPASGIGMEGRIPETRKEWLAKGGADASSRRDRQPVTWVRRSSSSSCTLAV